MKAKGRDKGVHITLLRGETYTLLAKCACGNVYAWVARCENPDVYAFSYEAHKDECTRCNNPASSIWRIARRSWVQPVRVKG